MPDESTIRLGSIAFFEMGQSPPSSIVVDGDGGVPFLQGCAENYGWHLVGYWAPDLRRVAQGTTFEAVGRDDLANLEVIGIAPQDRAALVTILDAAEEAIVKTEALIAKLK